METLDGTRTPDLPLLVGELLSQERPESTTSEQQHRPTRLQMSSQNKNWPVLKCLAAINDALQAFSRISEGPPSLHESVSESIQVLSQLQTHKHLDALTLTLTHEANRTEASRTKMCCEFCVFLYKRPVSCVFFSQSTCGQL